MIRKILLSLLIFIAATSAAHAATQTFNDRKANLTEVHALRVGYDEGMVRIVLDIAKPLEFTESYVENPSRMILDLKDAWLNSDVEHEMELKSSVATRIRIAQFNPTTVRIVIETAEETKPFNLEGGASGYRFVIDVGNPEPVKPPKPAKRTEPEPVKPTEPEPVKPTEPTPVKPPATEIPKDVEIVDPDEDRVRAQREQIIKEQREREKELLEQREREKKERELKEKQERELKERQERELKERQEQLIREQRERERELREQRERELKEKRKKKKEPDKTEPIKTEPDKTEPTKIDPTEPFKGLDTDLKKITTLSGKIIVIDPGHGGNDAGAIGPTGVMEKSVTLKVALELRKLLEAEGATVIMTRETDTTVSYKGAKASDIEELGARCEVANRAGADIFISIHADSFTRPEARGTTGYYYGKSTTGRGQRLADCIRRNLVEQLGTPSRGTQPCNFYVVRHTDMPATLIELGFISNKDEEKLLDSKEGVQKAAQGILDGIEDYFG